MLCTELSTYMYNVHFDTHTACSTMCIKGGSKRLLMCAEAVLNQTSIACTIKCVRDPLAIP